MLSRLEVAYLAILRVVLLIAASVALLVTFGAATMALPALGDIVGLTGHQRTHGGTLRQFIEVNRITDVKPSQEEATETSFSMPLPEKLGEASKNFARYDSRNGGEQVPQSKWDDLFRSVLSEKVPASLVEDYSNDIFKLSNQLTRSTGKPLSNERVFQLIEFHLDGFLADAQARENAKAGRLAGSLSKLLLAGGAFLIFVLVLFSFLFVKIERNLRVRDRPIELTGWTE